jgi:nitroimidazol reductase NimA-like FMN-containing flavoprotein (pyridoxamine 5'-phosphate oxidase superfamily)
MSLDYSNASPTAYQRLPDRVRNDVWIKSFLRTAVVGHVGHVAGGQPFITPTNFWYDEERHQLIFHSNVTGRVRWNLERISRVCFVASEYGRLLPSNAALEVSLQYRSVMAFGMVDILENDDEKQRALYGMLAKYFPKLHPGKEYRPITKQELRRTTVYAIKIDTWSGKESWKEVADQVEDWPSLPPDILNS